MIYTPNNANGLLIPHILPFDIIEFSGFWELAARDITLVSPL